ncbi:transglutaminase family protein [Paracoccus sp. 1_MG-2023]|uniref:transglutaminase-like domain-containing protein n=1 Tax=unclassified Paracoccus (in: a-proteobacteria) TaxID=2688777 RepID=UPI001C098D4B|nr:MULTISPECIES: transglutaminase family protein [unclassified Paracoccus (in: a-proteobacteria)]MBU2958732.1 transglutaminase family protein [Paracoccus sp. C2R09]MDO6667725.1 transglutaminase family protein [Paracoccus sp. 1_MG-2023]
MRMVIDVTLDYRLSLPGTAILMIEPASVGGQTVENCEIEFGAPSLIVRRDADEAIGERLVVDVEDRLTCRLHAEVSVDRPRLALAGLAATPLVALPADALRYLMPSRYCQVDSFLHFTSTRFSGLTGGALVRAIEDWIQRNMEYVGGISNVDTTAADTFVDRRGVCRDYAHLMISMCRAMQIPARIVSAFSPGVTPPDFHAVVEVFLDGAWHLVDPTGMADADTLAVIAVGRDATDVAFLTTTGPAQLQTQTVAVVEA